MNKIYFNKNVEYLDYIFLYTDGLNESIKKDKKEYSIITDIVDKFNKNFDYLPSKVKANTGIIIDELVNNQVSYKKKRRLEDRCHI